MSAAYYAGFHSLTQQVVREVVPAASDDDRHELCRAFTHSGVQKVTKWVRGDGAPPTRSEPLARTAQLPVLSEFAGRFIQLQQLRHDSDYDHRATIGRPTAVNACRSARRAIDLIAAAAREPGWTSFCTLMLMHGTGKTG